MKLLILFFILYILFYNKIKESFRILDSSSYITDISQLDPFSSYLVIKRKKSNTINEQINGGQGCIEFPDVVFQIKPPDSFSQVSVLNSTIPKKI
jgi:hypothetical protein